MSTYSTHTISIMLSRCRQVIETLRTLKAEAEQKLAGMCVD